MNRRAACTALIVFSALLPAIVHAQNRSANTDKNTRLTAHAIRGILRYAIDEKAAEMIKVELRRFAGDMVGVVFTRSNGEFEFSNLPNGTYYIVVEENGYEPVRDAIELVNGSRFGIVVYLKKIGAAPGESGNAVSVHELSMPREARAAFQKGMEVLYKKNNPAGSLAPLQQATVMAPAFYEAHFHMGIAYNQLNKPAEAEGEFRKAIEASQEKYPQALIALGSLLVTLQKPLEAEPLVRRGIGLDASLWQGHYELGRALVAQNRLEEAEKSLAEMSRLRNDYPPAYLLLANIHIRMKNQTALLGDLNEFLRLEPNGPQSPQAKKLRDSIQQSMESAKGAPAGPPKP